MCDFRYLTKIDRCGPVLIRQYIKTKPLSSTRKVRNYSPITSFHIGWEPAENFGHLTPVRSSPDTRSFPAAEEGEIDRGFKSWCGKRPSIIEWGTRRRARIVLITIVGGDCAVGTWGISHWGLQGAIARTKLHPRRSDWCAIMQNFINLKFLYGVNSTIL